MMQRIFLPRDLCITVRLRWTLVTSSFTKSGSDRINSTNNSHSLPERHSVPHLPAKFNERLAHLREESSKYLLITSMHEELPTLSKTVYPRPADPIGPSPGVPAGEIGVLDEARHHIDDVCHNHENNHEKREE